jgi:hypothetical protein
MKFIAFNVVVLGALFFLYQAAGGSVDSGPSQLEAGMPVVLADASPVAIEGLELVQEQLETLAAIEAHMDVRLEELEQRAARADALLAELNSRAAGSSAGVESVSAVPVSGPRHSKRASRAPTPSATEPTAEVKRVAAAEEKPPSSHAITQEVATPLPVVRDEEVWVQNERGVDTKVAQQSPQRSTLATVASGTSEFTVATKPAASPEASTEQAEPVVVEGELMSAQQRRGALLELAEEMEMQFLVSAGLSD